MSRYRAGFDLIASILAVLTHLSTCLLLIVAFCCTLARLQLVQVTAYPFGEQKSEFTLGVSGVLDLPLDYVLYAACKIPSEDGKHPALGLFASFTMPAKYGPSSRDIGSG